MAAVVDAAFSGPYYYQSRNFPAGSARNAMASVAAAYGSVSDAYRFEGLPLAEMSAKGGRDVADSSA